MADWARAQSPAAVEEILDRENKRMADSLASKVTRLKSLALDIDRDAEDQNRYLDSMDSDFTSMTGLLTGSMKRFSTMARSGRDNRKLLCDSMMGAWQLCCRPIRDLALLLPRLRCSAPTPVCKCGLLTLVPETTQTERTWGPNVCQGRTHCQALSHNSRTRRLTIKIWNKQLRDKVNTLFGVLIFLGA
ncbi:BET1-like protein isoform X1 [Ursus americanus]|uniref:BET1-like protein isoform X1 n=1 Tax=Ursus americanus TaxID=9643 RepID=UPI001E679538|nr:BET1-like protein isoform X1 [Ursus americanus]